MKKTVRRETATRRSSRHPSGMSLVEVVVAIGVLAVVAPLALAALLKATDTGAGARTETRSPAIVEACLEEVQVAEAGNSQYLPDIARGQDFPGGDQTYSLAFDRAGALIDKIDQDSYDRGIGQIKDTDVLYIATVKGKVEEPADGAPPLVKLTVAVEGPARLPAGKRSHQEFITRLP